MSMAFVFSQSCADCSGTTAAPVSPPFPKDDLHGDLQLLEEVGASGEAATDKPSAATAQSGDTADVEASTRQPARSNTRPVIDEELEVTSSVGVCTEE